MTKPLTIEELQSQAAQRIAQERQQQELDAPVYPQPEPEAEPARPTLAERWAEFWRNRRIAKLRALVRREEQLIDGMPEAIERARAEAEDEHYLRLQEIRALAAFQVAEAKHEIFKAEAELFRLEGK